MKKDEKLIYRFTMHFRQRVYERVFQEPWKGQSLRDKEIKEIFNNSVELLGWQNDIKMVDYFKSRYGHAKMKIFKYDKYIIVCKRDPDIPVLYWIMTVFEPSTTYYTTKINKNENTRANF